MLIAFEGKYNFKILFILRFLLLHKEKSSYVPVHYLALRPVNIREISGQKGNQRFPKVKRERAGGGAR